MSSAFDDGYDVAAIRDVGHDRTTIVDVASARALAHAESASAPSASVTISLSPEAKAAIETIERERVAEQARRGAKEVAVAAGVSEARVVQIAQPQRSPPPAKGAVLLQANLAAKGDKSTS